MARALIRFADQPLQFSLAEELHLWAIRVDVEAFRGADAEVLSDDEWERARRFRHELHRRRFITRRAALRELLAGYMGRDPTALRFTYGPHGKPAVEIDAAEGVGGAPPIGFNVSDSADLAVCLVGRVPSLGVDVEKIRHVPERDQIAARFYTAGEFAALAAAPESERTAVFYRFWTCKEALLKASGSGFGRPLDCFELDLEQHDQPRVVHADGDDPCAWSLLPFAADGGYMGAIAVRGEAPLVSACYYVPRDGSRTRTAADRAVQTSR
jgi:4'-phosphopantetheinyl transferase